MKRFDLGRSPSAVSCCELPFRLTSGMASSIRHPLGNCAGLFVLLLSMLVGTSPVKGATLIVTHAADTDDAVCDEDCSLRDAMNVASMLPGPDTINFAGDYTITLDSELPPIEESVTIDGVGRSVVISGGGLHRVLAVGSGATLYLNQVTIADGNADLGGGIKNSGTLNVSNSTFWRNTAGDGGGVANFGSSGELSVSNCTFVTNSSGFRGGGIFSTKWLNVVNSTFSSNSALWGGGIHSLGLGSTTIINSTFSENSTFIVSGGIYSGAARTTLKNTIVVNNGGADCGSNNMPFTADSFNLDSDGSCGDATTTQSANLGPLADNGGPTHTYALLPGSPAIDAGNDSVAAFWTFDQRGAGYPRFVGSAVDVGAFEFNPCNWLVCDDNNPCTADSCDPDSGCLHIEDQVRCDDTFSCTIDSCDPIAGCVHIPDNAFCSDGLYCNGVEVCDPTAPDHAVSGCRASRLPPCAGGQCDEGRDRCRIHPSSLLRNGDDNSTNPK